MQCLRQAIQANGNAAVLQRALQRKAMVGKPRAVKCVLQLLLGGHGRLFLCVCVLHFKTPLIDVFEREYNYQLFAVNN